jgi:hypothetical protein
MDSKVEVAYDSRVAFYKFLKGDLRYVIFKVKKEGNDQLLEASAWAADNKVSYF